MSQKGNVIIGILIGLLIAGGLFGAYYLGTLKTSKQQIQNPVISSNLPQSTLMPSQGIQSPTPSIIPSVNILAGWNTYTNTQAGIEFNYPKNYTITPSFDRAYNGIAYDINHPCSVSFGIKVSNNDFDPEGSFCLVKLFTSEQIGQISSINFDSEKNVWTVTQNGSPDQILSAWDKTKSGDEIIKTSGGGSEASSEYYFIPMSSENNQLIAVFTIPTAYRLRCDLITQKDEQMQCNDFYQSIINKYNAGQPQVDTWLPQDYLQTLYIDSETMVKSFNFTVTN